MPTVQPTHVTAVDTRDGNHFEIYKIAHDGTNVTDIPVSDACINAALLSDDITVAVVAAQETSTSAGITVRNQSSGASGLSPNSQVWVAGDGMKQITIAASVAAGTYFVVARFLGSAGGIGGGAKTLDY